jgi:hypothetical protein
MNGNSDFWLHLARTADAYNEGGLTSAERAQAAMDQFRDMPLLAQREVIQSLRSMALQLPDLYMIAEGQYVKARVRQPTRADSDAG